ATERAGTAKPLKDFLAAVPISEASKAQLLALDDAERDPLAGKSPAEKKALLKKTSYRDYLIKIRGCNEEVANCFQGRPLGFFGLGCDAVPAADVADFGYPGFAGLGLTGRHSAERREPYIYHFPDGNAALARLLVRALIPGIARAPTDARRSEEHTSELQSLTNLVCRLLLEKKKKQVHQREYAVQQ